MINLIDGCNTEDIGNLVRQAVHQPYAVISLLGNLPGKWQKSNNKLLSTPTSNPTSFVCGLLVGPIVQALSPQGKMELGP